LLWGAFGGVELRFKLLHPHDFALPESAVAQLFCVALAEFGKKCIFAGVNVLLLTKKHGIDGQAH
jgi:hypothetical protein